MEVNSVNFGATPVNKINILKHNKSAKAFVDEQAYVVKLDHNNRSDMSAVNKLVPKWKGAKYIQKIVTASHWMGCRENVEIDVYALTTQQKDFNKLRPNKILGLAEMRNNPKDEKDRILYHLQVKPTSMNVGNYGYKGHKHVGKGLIESLKKIYKNISLFSEDNPNILRFYESNGFIKDYKGSNHYSWSSNLFKRMYLLFQKYKYEKCLV